MLQIIKSILPSVGNGHITKKVIITMVVTLLVTSIGIIIVPIPSASAQSISGPAVSSRDTGRLNVFVIGPDHTLRNIAFFNGKFQPDWQQSIGRPAGVNLTSDPTAVSWDSHRIDVFARGSDNRVWWISWNDTSNVWCCWKSLPPVGGGSTTPGVSPVTNKSLGFESGSISTGWEWGKAEYQPGTTDRLVAVDKNSIQPSSIDPNGAKALKVTVQPNDLVSNGARAEVVLTKPLPKKSTYDFLPGEDVWYHWYTMFPSILTIPNSWHVWTQMHQEASISTCRTAQGTSFSCGVIPMGFNFRNYPSSHPEPRRHSVGETLEFTVINKTDVNQDQGNPNGLGYGDDILWAAPLQHGHWYDILLHVKWEPCASYAINGKCTNNNGGFVEMWVDGNNVVPKTTHFTMDDDGKAYLKQGLYHCNPTVHRNCPPTNTQTIYHDGMMVAECPSTHVYYHPNSGKCYTTPQ